MKKIWLALLTCLMFVFVAFAVACGGGKPVFNEGYLTEIVLGEPIMLDEYIDPETTDDYTMILTCDETGETRDLKELFQWTTDTPGTYTLTYTVKSGENKGTISTKINVVVPKVTWQYTLPTMVYRAGDTMEFGVLERNLNLMVKSYYNYEFFIKKLQFNGNQVELDGETEYTFTEAGDHVVTFAIETEDGQELAADIRITVRPQQILAEGAAEWMAENNITAHDYTYISPDGKVTLDAGYFNSYVNNNSPYIAFNGEEGVGYGEDTYVMVDFTGKNLPQVAFFCDEVTSSITDGKNGIIFTNGITNNNGTDFYGNDKLNMSRLTIFGPKKASFPEFDNRGRILSLGSVADPCPMSYHALNATDSYRYIIGIEEVKVNYFISRIILVNMSTGERVFDHHEKYGSASGSGTFNFEEGYFSGSIVLYGRYGLPTELDKVHLPITGVTDIYELDKAAQFKDSYATQYDLNATVNVSDYIDIPDGDYEFIVYDPSHKEVEIAEDGSFQYTQSGKYTLYFDSMQEGMRASAITVRVMYDLDNVLAPDYLEVEGAIMAGPSDAGVITNTKQEFVKEGKQSVQAYTISGTSGTVDFGISRSFLEFVFLSRRVRGITLEVYSLKAATFALRPETGKPIVQDYTGSVEAETWTTLTITREMYMRNSDVYSGKGYCLVISFTPTEGKFMSREAIYVDNIQLIVKSAEPTITDGAQEFLTENNITLHGVDSVNDDMQVKLQEGTYQKEWWNLTNDDVPYVAYNGNYAAGSYVVVDFTGKNVPQIALFVDKVTASLSDGNKGLYIHTGMVKKNGALVSDTDGGRITFLGPNKWEYGRPDAEGRVGKQFGTKAWYPDGSTDSAGTAVSPLSIRGLEDGVRYRYVVGIKTASEESTTKGRIVLELLLINLDTKQEVVKYEWSEATEGLHSLIGGGSIVLYSRLNAETTFDKIYPVYEKIGSIYAIDLVADVIG